MATYRRLLDQHGPQDWWPGESPFEVMAGAVLTQNTAWINVERAIENLKRDDLLDPQSIVAVPISRLAARIKPAGYFNVKARRLRNFCSWYMEKGGYASLSRWNTASLRRGLLSVNGIGRETADDILLYAFHRDVFVIDAYTRRIFSRLGFVNGDEDYDTMREVFERTLVKEWRSGDGNNKGSTSGKRKAMVRLFNEFHALVVNHGKDICRVKPRCEQCCLSRYCPTSTGQPTVSASGSWR